MKVVGQVIVLFTFTLFGAYAFQSDGLRPRGERVFVATPRWAKDTQLDPAARLVDSSESIRRALAPSVAFASTSNWLAQCVYVACELKVFDALERGPLTVDAIAAEVGADASALGRLLRALGGQGPIVGAVVEVFDPPLWPLPFTPPVPLPVPPPVPYPINILAPKSPRRTLSEEQRKYALTPLGALLRTNAVSSLRPWAVFSGAELGAAWGGLLTAVRAGHPDFEASQQRHSWSDRGSSSSSNYAKNITSNGFFEYMAANPAAGTRFDESMSAVSNYVLEAGRAADLFDWTSGGTAKIVVDVGGGTGTLLAAILAKHPSLHGILFDQEQVLEGAISVLEAAGNDVSSRCELQSGNFFDQIPLGGDVYTMKNILHDWPDAEAVALLRVVANAMRRSVANPTLVILDMVCSDRLGHEPWKLDFSDFFDLNMLVTVGGKERTRGEWELLVEQAGLKIISVAPGPGVSAIEAKLATTKM